uniref:EF-hand domain-containing protein n=1 Tax=Rattus norvegicus TaxID=10116 RepID=F1M053_RAT
MAALLIRAQTEAPVPDTVSRSRSPASLLNLAKMPTETERCIEFLLAVFQMHCGKGRNSRQLSKTEFLPFMNTEMAPFTKNPKDPGVLDRGMKQLDRNSDGRLDFQEFLNLIGGLAMACHESFLGSSGSKQKCFSMVSGKARYENGIYIHMLKTI